MKKTNSAAALDVEEKPLKVFLVGIREGRTSKAEAESLSNEVLSLCKTLGLELVGQESVHIREKTAQYGMGTGKAAELAQKAAELEADCIVFDREISPTQQRNWEELINIPVIDRQELILKIFEGRARTKEAMLQINLAELYYSLPRLQHKYIDLNRQRGGRYGTKGSGETRLETDRRRVEKQIHKLEKELEEVRRQRDTQRKQRKKAGLAVCAIVGYTNAGKSLLLNTMTGADVLSEDKLFATLDSTLRRIRLPSGQFCILADTVGFIRRLPHSLVSAFRSTLEEVTLADILIHVLDASDPGIEAQHKTTMSVLRELNADAIPRITVLNKIDRCTGFDAAFLEAKDEFGNSVEAIRVSALTGEGLPELIAKMDEMLAGRNAATVQDVQTSL